MEVVEECSELLANKQVMEILKEYTSKKQTNLATILYETKTYLESSPTATTSLNNIAKFLDKIKEHKYDLTKLEKIQIVNLVPLTENELELLIDNIDARFSQDQRNELLNLIQAILGSPNEDEKTEPVDKKVKC